MPQQPRLDVLQLERLFQERIVVEINLSDRQIVCRAPVSVHLARQFRRESLRFHSLPCLFAAPESRIRHTERAIINSSSVRIIRTVTRAEGAEITAAFSKLSDSFSAIPRKVI